jgi:hypothetical protein
VLHACKFSQRCPQAEASKSNRCLGFPPPQGPLWRNKGCQEAESNSVTKGEESPRKGSACGIRAGTRCGRYGLQTSGQGWGPGTVAESNTGTDSEDPRRPALLQRKVLRLLSSDRKGPAVVLQTGGAKPQRRCIGQTPVPSSDGPKGLELNPTKHRYKDGRRKGLEYVKFV